MGQRLVQFGTGATRTYTFPNTQNQFQTNFASAVPATVRLPGMSGGYDAFGRDAAPQEVGRVTCGFMLVANTRAEMEAMRDALVKTRDWGVQRLIMQPSNPIDYPRWCNARINNISMPQVPNGSTDLWQPVTIDFQVSDPRWYSSRKAITAQLTLVSGATAWGDAYAKWGDGYVRWGAPVTTVTGSLQASGGIAQNLGTALTRPLIRFTATSLVTRFEIQRVEGGVIMDQLIYNGTLNPGEKIEVDTQKNTFLKNGAAYYGTEWYFKHPDIMRFFPGTTYVNILLGASDQVGDVSLLFFYAYY